MDFFYNSICHVCKEYKKGSLKRCGSCKVVAYCCKDHQISDWKNHKQICRLLKNSSKFVNLDINCGYDRWRSYRTYLQFYLTQNLGRDMKPYENQMWMFPRVCAVCYSSENLKDCENCLCVAYCSEEHRTSHAQVHSYTCNDLKLCLDYDCFHLNVSKTEIKFKEIDENIRKLPYGIQESMEVIVDMSNSNYLQKIYSTDILGTILTVIYSLEKCEILQNRNLKTRDLVVHMVGADISELSTDWNLNFTLLNKWVKNLNSCKFVFIGPDCKYSEFREYKSDNIKIEIVNDFYHNAKYLDKPNLIVALNSGLHEFQLDEDQDTWKKSFYKLINNEAPLVLTSYTRQELEDDLERLKLFPTKTILEIQKNAFSNLRPIRDWDSEGYTPFYVNGYISIIAGSN